MHEKGREMIKKSMIKKKLTGLDTNCDYLPCHIGLEDCTFCYCPIYQCNDTQTGGFEKLHSRTGKPVWACSSCIFPHITENAEKILKGLIKLNLGFNSISREDLLKLRLEILNERGD